MLESVLESSRNRKSKKERAREWKRVWSELVKEKKE